MQTPVKSLPDYTPQFYIKIWIVKQSYNVRQHIKSGHNKD